MSDFASEKVWGAGVDPMRSSCGSDELDLNAVSLSSHPNQAKISR